LQAQTPTRCTTAGPNWVQQLVTLVNHTQLIGVRLSLSSYTLASYPLHSLPWVAQLPTHRSSSLHHPTSGARLHLSLPTLLQIRLRGMHLTLCLPFPSAVSSPCYYFPRQSLLMSIAANDVNNSYKNANGNGTAIYDKDLTSYFATVDRLYQAGARQFLFNNVIPFDRAQTGISVGATLQTKLKVVI
jgi:hypothetical protein